MLWYTPYEGNMKIGKVNGALNYTLFIHVWMGTIQTQNSRLRLSSRKLKIIQNGLFNIRDLWFQRSYTPRIQHQLNQIPFLPFSSL